MAGTQNTVGRELSPEEYNIMKYMARNYRYRRRKRDMTNELLFLAAAGTLLVVGGIGGSSDGFSSRAIAILLVVLCLVAVVILGCALFINFRRQLALRLLDMAAVDTMPGLDFEKWVGAQLRARGYHVRLTPINDYGVDIVAKKDGIKTAVQVKRYRKVLDQKPIREAVAGMMHYKCSRSMVVTNSHFTEAAKVLAKSNHCELIDRYKLAAWLAEQQPRG
jgi:restriction system protein